MQILRVKLLNLKAQGHICNLIEILETDSVLFFNYLSFMYFIIYIKKIGTNWSTNLHQLVGRH